MASATATIGTITNAAYLGVGIFLIVLTAIFAAMRCLVSMHQSKRLLLDDWLTIFAFIVTVGFYIFNEIQYQSFFREASLSYYTATGIAVPILAAVSLWASKVPVLLLYTRIFSVHRWVRYTCYIVIVISGLGFIVSLVPTWMQCRPYDRPYTPAKWSRCGKANVDTAVAHGALAVAVDLIILALPLRPISTLHLSMRKKIGLALVFCSGIFGVLASVLSLVYKVHLFLGARGDNGSILTSMLLQFVECAIALIVGCVPAARGFWNTRIVTSKLYSSIGSIVGSGRSNKSERGYHADHHEMESKYGDMPYAGDNIRRETYIRMESAPADGGDNRQPLPYR